VKHSPDIWFEKNMKITKPPKLITKGKKSKRLAALAFNAEESILGAE
jgi:hypothetical protein